VGGKGEEEEELLSFGILLAKLMRKFWERTFSAVYTPRVNCLLESSIGQVPS